MNSHFKQTQALPKSYVRKVMTGLKNIKVALGKFQKNPTNPEHAIEIRGIAAAISELAMIHGYHGVESIARKISISFKRSRVNSDPNFLSKIELAVKGIQHVVAMEEGIESKLIIERGIRASKDQCNQVASLDKLSDEQRKRVELESDAKLLFDINESDFINNIPAVINAPTSDLMQTKKQPS